MHDDMMSDKRTCKRTCMSSSDHHHAVIILTSRTWTYFAFNKCIETVSFSLQNTMFRKNRVRDRDVESLTSSTAAYVNAAFELGEDNNLSSSRCETPSIDATQTPRVETILPSLPEEETIDSDEDQQEDQQQERKSKKKTSSILMTVCVTVSIIVPLIMMLVGFLFVSSCPGFPSLPILVFMAGAVMSVGNTFNLLCGVLDSTTSTSNTSVTHMVAAKGNLVINITTLLLWLTLLTWIHLHTRPSSFPASEPDSLMNNNTEMSSIGNALENATHLHEIILSEKPPLGQECSMILYLFSLYLVNCLLMFLTCVAVIHALGFLGVFHICSAVCSKVKGWEKLSRVSYLIYA